MTTKKKAATNASNQNTKTIPFGESYLLIEQIEAVSITGKDGDGHTIVRIAMKSGTSHAKSFEGNKNLTEEDRIAESEEIATNFVLEIVSLIENQNAQEEPAQ